MKTLLLVILLCFDRGTSTGVPDDTNDVGCCQMFYKNKVKLYLTFNPDNPKLNNITNGIFRSQNDANLTRIDQKLQLSKIDPKKHFIEMDIFYHDTRYFIYAYFMNKNIDITAKVCEFRSLEQSTSSDVIQSSSNEDCIFNHTTSQHQIDVKKLLIIIIIAHYLFI